jgi:putative ABC transport system substrate-binding protein
VGLHSEQAKEVKDFVSAFDAMVREHADALIVLSDSFMTAHRVVLAKLAAQHRLPTLYGHNLYTEAGGLMSYGPSIPDLLRGAAAYVDKILKGAKPAELPVQQPVKFDLIVNLKTAKALGLDSTNSSRPRPQGDRIVGAPMSAFGTKQTSRPC